MLIAIKRHKWEVILRNTRENTRSQMIHNITLHVKRSTGPYHLAFFFFSRVVLFIFLFFFDKEFLLRLLRQIRGVWFKPAPCTCRYVPTQKNGWRYCLDNMIIWAPHPSVNVSMRQHEGGTRLKQSHATDYTRPHTEWLGLQKEGLIALRKSIIC